MVGLVTDNSASVSYARVKDLESMRVSVQLLEFVDVFALQGVFISGYREPVSVCLCVQILASNSTRW